MDKNTATLMQQITAFEKQLKSGAGSPRRARKVAQPKKSKLASEIAAVEKILAGFGSYMDEEPGCGEPGMMGDGMGETEYGLAYMDDDLMDDDELMYDDDLMDDDELMYDDDLMDDEYPEPSLLASEADPSGIEEEITDDRFSEVSRITGDDDISDAQNTLDAAPTRLSHTAGLKMASKRLDRLASYIEQKVAAGENKKWLKVAYRIDQMADSIDARINAAKEDK